MSLSLNKIWSYALLGFTLVCGTLHVQAQEIVVKDPALAAQFCLYFPDAMSADCKKLDTIKAESLYPSPLDINMEGANITNADELIYFKNADSIRLSFNKIKSFPTDLFRFRSLVRLNLAHNELKVATDIKWNNPISGDTIIKLVYFNHNLIDSIPPSWFEVNGLVQVIDLYDNLLDTIPDFGTYNELRRLDVRKNYLQFDDLAPIKDNVRWNTSQFDLFPQKPFKIYEDLTVKKGESLTLDFSEIYSGESYTLMKNDKNYQISNDGVFVLNDLSFEDTATYWVKVRNDTEFPAQTDFLRSTSFKIKLHPELQSTNTGVQIFSPNNDGQDDYIYIEGEGNAVFYDKNGREILSHELPYEWKGNDKNGQTVEPGLYIIKRGERDYLKVLISY